MIITSGRFASQPQYNALINPEWIKRGLVVACNPAVGAYNQVTRQNVTNSGGLSTTPTNAGKSWQGVASWYIDFGSGFDPGTSGMTVLQVVNPGTAVNTFSYSSRSGTATLGTEFLIGNGGVAGIARFRMHTPEVVTGDVTGLSDNKDHVLVARFIPSTEIKIWADHLGKNSANTTSIPASTTSSQNLRLHNRGGTIYTGKSGLFLYFDRPLSDVEIRALLRNPYVVYEAPTTKIWVAVSGGGNNYSLASDSGAFAVTGAAASLKYGRLVSASTGSVAITGTAAALKYGSAFSANSGSFAVTGTAASLLVGRALSANAGSFVVTGTDATLTKATGGQFTLSADSGSFVVTGNAASLVCTRYQSASSDSVIVTGTAATLKASRALLASSGAVSVTGTDATLTLAAHSHYSLTAAGGSVDVIGANANLVRSGGDSFSGGYPYISRESHAERKKKQRIKLGIEEEEKQEESLAKFDAILIPPDSGELEKQPIPARQQKKLEQEAINAELKQLLQLEIEREEETILRMLMEL